MSESPILSVKNLKTYFDVTKGVFAKKQIVKAVDDVSFDVMPNETLDRKSVGRERVSSVV